MVHMVRDWQDIPHWVEAGLLTAISLWMFTFMTLSESTDWPKHLGAQIHHWFFGIFLWPCMWLRRPASENKAPPHSSRLRNSFVPLFRWLTPSIDLRIVSAQREKPFSFSFQLQTDFFTPLCLMQSALMILIDSYFTALHRVLCKVTKPQRRMGFLSVKKYRKKRKNCKEARTIRRSMKKTVDNDCHLDF